MDKKEKELIKEQNEILERFIKSFEDIKEGRVKDFPVD